MDDFDEIFTTDFPDEPAAPSHEQVEATAQAAGRAAAQQFVQETAVQIAQARAASDFIALERERVLGALRQEFPFLDQMIESDAFWKSEPILFEAITSAVSSPQQVGKLEGILRIAAKIYSGRSQQPQTQPNAPAQAGYYAPQTPQRAPAPELVPPDLSSSRDRQRYIRQWERKWGDVEI